MTISAFGVEHEYEVNKAAKKKKPKKPESASFGRHATTYFFPGVHGLVAGKRGRKWRSAGSEVGYQAAGTVGGAVAGAAGGAAIGHLTHRSAMGARIGANVGASAGAIGSTVHVVNRNQARGRYKPEV